MLTQLNLRGIQETLPVEDVMTDLDPVEAPVETDAAPRKPAHDESWGTRILLGTATALTLNVGCPMNDIQFTCPTTQLPTDELTQ